MVVNYTRFLILTKNRAVEIPTRFLAAPCCSALFRIVVGSSISNDQKTYGDGLMDILKLLDKEMSITRIDRRPNPKAALFHDIYFVEVKKLFSVSFPDIVAWAAEVDKIVQIVRQAGGEVDVIGIW